MRIATIVAALLLVAVTVAAAPGHADIRQEKLTSRGR
jgi:hypothetical protein